MNARDAGAQYFHRDFATIRQHGRNAPGLTEALAKASHQTVEHLAEFLFVGGLPVSATASAEGNGRHLILQFGEFVGDVSRASGRVGGKHLAELDEDWSPVVQRKAQSFCTWC